MTEPSTSWDAAVEAAEQNVAVELEKIRDQMTDHLSIKDWLDRVSGAGKVAFSAARGGAPMEEFKAWSEMAAIATMRAAEVWEVIGVQEKNAGSGYGNCRNCGSQEPVEVLDQMEGFCSSECARDADGD